MDIFGRVQRITRRKCKYYKRTRTLVLIAVFLLSLGLVAQYESLDSGKLRPDFDSSGARDDAAPFLTDHTSTFDHYSSLYETLNNAKVEELRGLLSDSQDIPHTSIRLNSQFAIASRLASINPQEALDVAIEYSHSERSSLIAGVFAEWCESDLDGAVEAAVSLDRNARVVALKTIVDMRDDLTAAELRAIARLLGHNRHVMDSESESWISELAADPIEAWNILTHDGLDDSTQIDSLVVVAEAAIEGTGVDALFQLQGPVGGYWNKYFWEDEILSRVVEALVKNDPINTWAYIQNGSKQLLTESLEQSSSLGKDTVSRRDQAYMVVRVQELLLKSWAALNPQMVLDRMDQIPRKLQALACERALVALAATDPERAVGMINALKHLGAARYWTVRGTVEQWSTANPSAALDWVLTSEEIEHLPREDLLELVLDSLVLEDAERALEVAAQQPKPSSLEADVIEKLAESDVEAAIELLPSVSEEARDLAVKWVSDRLFNMGEADRALALLLQHEESSENPEAVSWFMSFLTWASANPIQLFERLEDMAPKLRYWGAYALDYNYAPALTQEQKDYVRAIREEGEP